MKKVEGNKDIGRLLFASITRPINAALAGAGTLFAVAGVHNLPLGLVGAVMLLGTTYSMGRDLSSPPFVDGVLNDGSPMKEIPEIPESLAGQYRLQCLEAKRHMEKTIEAMESGGPDMAEELRPVRDQIMDSVESVYRLAEKAHRIDGSLTLSSRNEINKEIDKIKAQHVLTTDNDTRKHLERTLEQKLDQLKTYDDLALRVKRIQAQMQHINATLDNVQLKVLNIISSGVGQTDEVTLNLQSLLREVHYFEGSLDSAVAENLGLPSPDGPADWDARLEQRNRLPSGHPADHSSPSLEGGRDTPAPDAAG